MSDQLHPSVGVRPWSAQRLMLPQSAGPLFLTKPVWAGPWGLVSHPPDPLGVPQPPPPPHQAVATPCWVHTQSHTLDLALPAPP